ncbi:origin recognition complex subunit 3 [Cimex lectularius]|uniref:Origin recognition complex subunit 3 n=1 Tax=Cimex lectularius TaxID=79782 RepID=A0A8I6SPS7_CIMLE|nr:origin recognition complex subunit 3 [Cimex lectularius]
MSETQSVSQGCFAFRPKALNGKKKVLLPDPLNIFSKQLWHNSYKRIWESIEKKIENIDDSVTESLLKDLVNFISDAPPSQQIPTAAILTGINLPDHNLLFGRLEQKLKAEGVARSVATLRSADCVSVRHTVERAVGQLISCPEQIEETVDSSDEEENVKLKRYQCTLPRLVEWYTNPNSRSPPKKVKTSEKKLIIIIKDFETFSDRILHDFIQILSGYRDRLPIILIFGIATTITALSDILNHKTTSRLLLKTFQSQPSVYFLNNTLNKIFLTPECPFQLSRKLLQFFTNVFLFYDFSVNRFIQAIKYCLMEHFREGQQTIGLLCTTEENINDAVGMLKHDDLEWIRNLESFKNYVKTEADEQMTKNDEHTRLEVLRLMLGLKTSIKEFYVGLNLLHILVSNLPQAPLGKHFREIYCTALNKDITKLPEYKECRQLLGFLSKEKLIDKLEKLLMYLSNDSIIEWNLEIAEKIVDFKEKLESLDTKPVTKSPSKSPKKIINMNIKSRAELRQRVFEMGGDKSQFDKIRSEILDELMGHVIPKAIKPFTSKPLWEVVTLVESDARYRVVPRVRAPIHTALNNPANYLLCDCCKLKYPGEILPTMPDICIVYKLHLESGNLINMYDWLQSFNIIVNPGKDDTDIDPKVQARFTQAVSELEYMGFIKSSKKKMDHMQRLTWGGQSKV